ncbi:hypothetical protein Raf01_55810 [Rugosimonospora africana]|uniref:Uncharacterized protein n=1 Tax=Rugosimonospora africana TaxID=556532 RepID=A0A8J3VSV0_9ACTN|nr:hypothetical protein Raf01_55810 [Rugosimonospora africana]
MLVAVTAEPLWLTCALQDDVICWPAEYVQVTVQPCTGLVPAVTSTYATNPPLHWFTRYATWHPLAALASEPGASTATVAAPIPTATAAIAAGRRRRAEIRMLVRPQHSWAARSWATSLSTPSR